MNASKIRAKTKILTKISRMYYMQNMSQSDIAKELKIGRSSVGHYLSEARKLGIVKITIVDEKDNFRNSVLENEMIQRFNLVDCFITDDKDGTISNHLVDYLDDVLPYKGILGVGGGFTTYNLGTMLQNSFKRPNLSIIQLNGFTNDFEETSITRLYASALDSKPLFLPSPLLVKDIKSKIALENDPSIKTTLSALKKVDTIITGIGCNKTNDNAKYLKAYDFLDIDSLYKRTIADIGFHFFNEKGEFPIQEIEEKIIGISMKDFLATTRRIAIVYNSKKANVLKVALKHHIINIAITNTNTAKALLDLD